MRVSILTGNWQQENNATKSQVVVPILVVAVVVVVEVVTVVRVAIAVAACNPHARKPQMAPSRLASPQACSLWFARGHALSSRRRKAAVAVVVVAILLIAAAAAAAAGPSSKRKMKAKD